MKLIVTNHNRDIFSSRYVYPVVSRRAGGLSLGINLNTESDVVTKSEERIISDLIREREEARKLKDFQRADSIRDKLHKMNINIEDSVEGTKWIKNE